VTDSRYTEKQWKRDLEWKDHIDSKYGQFYSDSSNAVISYGLAAIRGAFMLNGGGAVALLAFMAQSSKAQHFDLSSPLRLFVFGAILAALTASVSYLSQSFISEKIAHDWNNAVIPSSESERASWSWGTFGRVCQLIACALVVISYVCFWEGIDQAYSLLKSPLPTG